MEKKMKGKKNYFCDKMFLWDLHPPDRAKTVKRVFQSIASESEVDTTLRTVNI